MATNMNYNPNRTMNELQQQLQRLFGNFESDAAPAQSWSPVVDIYETENELVLLTELPGMKEDDFKLSTENNVLTITGERKFNENGKQVTFYRNERPLGNFNRSFALPANVDLTNVSAQYRNGILNVKLPKKAEAKPRQIPIKAK